MTGKNYNVKTKKKRHVCVTYIFYILRMYLGYDATKYKAPLQKTSEKQEQILQSN